MRGARAAMDLFPDAADNISVSLHCETAEIMRAYTKMVEEAGELSGLEAYNAARPPHSEGLAIAVAAYLAHETDFPNIKVKTFPEVVLKAMKKANDEVMDGYAAKNAEFKAVYDSQKEYMAKARKWTKMSDYYYIQTSELVE